MVECGHYANYEDFGGVAVAVDVVVEWHFPDSVAAGSPRTTTEWPSAATVAAAAPPPAVARSVGPPPPLPPC